MQDQNSSAHSSVLFQIALSATVSAAQCYIASLYALSSTQTSTVVNIESVHGGDPRTSHLRRKPPLRDTFVRSESIDVHFTDNRLVLRTSTSASACTRITYLNTFCHVDVVYRSHHQCGTCPHSPYSEGFDFAQNPSVSTLLGRHLSESTESCIKSAIDSWCCCRLEVY